MKKFKLKKNIIKPLLIIWILSLLVAVGIIANEYFGNAPYDIGVMASKTAYAGSTYEGLITVKDNEKNQYFNSKVDINLINEKGKKVRKTHVAVKTDSAEGALFEMKLPEDVETGGYSLKVTAHRGLFKETDYYDINIVNNKNSNLIVSFDKGIYKPGDTIQYRVLDIAKSDNTPVKDKSLTVQIFDGNNNRVYYKDFTTSEYGIISGEFSLADTVNSGEYKLIAESDTNSVTKNFKVNPYITPQFEVKINTDKEEYFEGDDAVITVNSKYFFGEPVAKAKVVFRVDNDEYVGITDENGNYSYELNDLTKGNYNVSCEVVDSSNYYIEASSTFNVASSKIKFDIVPEFGKILEGFDNTFYVYAKTNDNKPIKAYIKIFALPKSFEIVTDENGFGKFTISDIDLKKIDEVRKGHRKITFTAVVDDYEKTVSATSTVDITSVNDNKVYISTDKNIYDQGNDIFVKLKTNNISNTYICVAKDGEVLQTIKADSDIVRVNVGDQSGLIDIFTFANGANKSSVPSVARTIFVTPSEELKIGIKVDKDVYNPGDTLKLSLTTEDENNNKVEAGMLVSILDNAILNLADNDLSLNNIKMALDGLNFTDGISATDLYLSAINEKDHSLLESILIKQNATYDLFQGLNKTYNDSYENVKMICFTVSIAIFVMLGLWFLFFLNNPVIKKIRGFLVTAVMVLILTFVINIFTESFLEDVYWKYDLCDLLIFITNLLLAIIVYSLGLYKQREILSEMMICLCIIPVVALVCFIPISYLLMEVPFLLIVFLALVIGLIILIKKGILKIYVKENATKNLIIRVGKSLVYYLLFAILSGGFNLPTGLAVLLVLVVFFISEKIGFRKHKSKMVGGKVILNISGAEIFGMIVGACFILMLITSLRVVRNFATNIADVEPMHKGELNNHYDGAFAPALMDSAADTTGTSSVTNKFTFGGFNLDSFDTAKNDIVEESISNNETIESNFDSASEDAQVTANKEQKVRNLFLESLAFLPEVISQNGQTDIEVPISDNITTWNIQVLGNTKNGRLGHSQSEFKVFKEYFIDFNLPSNSVVTDKISIPLTVYNYTEEQLTVDLKVVDNDWSKIGEYPKQVVIPAKETQLVYIPTEIVKDGSNTLRIESSIGKEQDIVEKTFVVKPNGYEINEIVANGTTKENIEQPVLFRGAKDVLIPGTESIGIKVYPSTMGQVIEGMEEMIKMPTGCFEQTSSSLYPDILILKYLNDNDLNETAIEQKAYDYISKGYQRLLTFEVSGTKGGYSLFGDNPAETLITAFGVLEMSDLKKVYDIVEQSVIDDMKDYVYSQRNLLGSFDYKGSLEYSFDNTDDLAMNAYIIWALSEADPNDKRLDTSVKYLEDKFEHDDRIDNFTLALMANVFSNTNSRLTDKVIEKLASQVKLEDNKSYIDYHGCDYWGTKGNIQTVALFSMALSKEGKNANLNEGLINYIISNKREHSLWGSTQSTILALRALDVANNKGTSDQTITLSINDLSKDFKVDKKSLDYYEIDSAKINGDNNTASIKFQKGSLSYEILRNYYVSYEKATEMYNSSNSDIVVVNSVGGVYKVNDVVKQKINVENLGDNINNEIIRVYIPQGCTVLEESLGKMLHEGLIERYEYNYSTVDLYVRNVNSNFNNLYTIEYRTRYPEVITGGAVEVYDYYNPERMTVAAPELFIVD